MRRFRVKPFSAPAWIMPAIQSLRPKICVPASQWAEENRVMPDTNAIPGPMRNSLTPYLVEIMDAATSNSSLEQLIFVKSAQTGGTTAAENILGCLIDQQPAPAMIVYPSDDLAERTVDAKFLPMIRGCKVLSGKYRESLSSKLRLKFSAMTVYLTGANSPADLSSTNIRYLFLDEVDKFPGASKKESDPVSLAIERTKSYASNRFIFMTSTPTLRTGRIWRAKEDADAEKHYFVPCPHCGQFIELKFAQLKWPSKEEVPDITERSGRACYACQACGGIVTDRERAAMVQNGRWQFVRKNTSSPQSVAYWISTLYSPFTSFVKIAREAIQSADDPERMQNFKNSWLAEPWEPAIAQTSADLVMKRQTDCPAWSLPPWTKLLTGGVDVQHGSLYWTIRAWGPGMTSQNVAHGQALSMAEVERVMNTAFLTPDGQTMMVELALVDSGDQTDAVYEFCMHNSDWARPCKGVSSLQGMYRISTVNKPGSRANGLQLVLVYGDSYKDMIAARMQRDNGTGSWMVHKDCDLDYANQVTAEQKVPKRSSGTLAFTWEPKTSHAANHYLDCEVYAAAAADIMEVRSFLVPDPLQDAIYNSSPENFPAPETPPPAPEQDWIQKYESWL